MAYLVNETICREQLSTYNFKSIGQLLKSFTGCTGAILDIYLSDNAYACIIEILRNNT